MRIRSFNLYINQSSPAFLYSHFSQENKISSKNLNVQTPKFELIINNIFPPKKCLLNNYRVINNREKDGKKQGERGKDRQTERKSELQNELLSYFHSWYTGESSRDVWNLVNGHHCSYGDACNNCGAVDPLFNTNSVPRMSRGLCNENCIRAHYLTPRHCSPLSD